MSYSVGREDGDTVLIVGSPSGGGFTSTLAMNEGETVQMIKLLAATLENYGVEVYPHINIEKKSDE